MKYELTSTWGDEEIQAIQKVIDSDIYSMATRRALEKNFRNTLGQSMP